MTEEKIIKNVLVVDDEPTVLKLIEMTLRKAFKITKFSNPIEALEFLKTGYKPGIIISDLMMPEMYGTEFLKKSIEIVPNAVRIIVTAYSSSKEVIASINKAHAYMFIKKPWENIELFQSVVVAWDKYEADQRLLFVKSKGNDIPSSLSGNKKSDSNENLKEQLALLNEESKKDKETISQLKEIIKNLKSKSEIAVSNRKELALSYSYIIHEFEKLWFTNHTENVHNIVEYLLKRLNLPENQKLDIEMASLLHNIVITQMPDNLKCSNPNILDEKNRKRYFYYFSESLNILNKMEHLSGYYSMIGKIWEHKNGSGFPNGISEDEFDIGSQIIAIANIYHTSVYGLTNEQFQKLQINGEITQTYAETDIRRKQAIKDFYKKTNWFDRDLLLTFQDLVKENICNSLKPVKETLKIDLKKLISINANDNVPTESENKKSSELVGTQNSNKQEFREFNIEDIKVGMKTAQNIITKTGMTIVKSDTEINTQALNTIQRFYAKGMLPRTILFYIN